MNEFLDNIFELKDENETSVVEIGGLYERAVETTATSSDNDEPVAFYNTRAVENLFPNTYTSPNTTKNSDGSITINTGDGRAWSSLPQIKLPAGTYTLWCTGDSKSTIICRTTAGVDVTGVTIPDSGTGSHTFTSANEISMGMKLDSNGGYPKTVRVMIVEGSTAPTEWYPNYNETTVLSSVEAHGATVTRHKQEKLWGRYAPAVASDTTSYPIKVENLFNKSKNAVIPVTSSVSRYGNIISGLNGTYTISQGSYPSSDNGSYYRLKTGSTYGTGTAISDAKTITITSGQDLIIHAGSAISESDFDALNIQLEAGSTASPYVPYGINIFVHDTTANKYGYFNTSTSTFTEISGATGTDIKRVTYIQSDGNSYIDTDLLLDGSEKWTMKFASLKGELSTPVAGSLNGGTSFTSTNNFSVTYTTATSPSMYSIYVDGNAGSTNNSWNGGRSADKTWHTIEYFGNVNTAPKIDGVNMTTIDSSTTRIAVTPSVPWRLFGRMTTAKGTGTASQDGVAIARFTGDTWDFVPVKIGTEYAMLDLIDFAVYHNKGTGSFTGGSVIPDDVICPQVLSGNKGDIKYEYVGTQGVVDMGTLNWSVVDTLFIGSLSDIYAPASSGDRNKGFAFSSLYSPDTQLAITGTSMHDMKALKRANEIIIKDIRYATATDFKASVSGIYLFYQRATDESYVPPTKQLVGSTNHTISIYENGITSKTKLANYAWHITYDSIDYDSAWTHFLAQGDFPKAGCTSIAKGNYFGRNYDWTYSNEADVVVHTNNGKKVVGVASVPGLTDSLLTSNTYHHLYDLLPFYLKDGINEDGLTISMNVVPTSKFGTKPALPTSTKEKSINVRMLIRYLLDNFSNATDAVNYVKEHCEVFHPRALHDQDFEVHFLVADPTHQYILEFINGHTEIINKSYMTNFHLYGVTPASNGTVTTTATGNPITANGIEPDGCGLERYNIVANGINSVSSVATMRTLLDSVKYSLAYSSSNNWYSEFLVGNLKLNSPTSDFSTILTWARNAWTNKDRNNPIVWQTTHSVIYDMANKTMKVRFQEVATDYDFTLTSADTPTYTPIATIDVPMLWSADDFVDSQTGKEHNAWAVRVLNGTESYVWGNPSVTLSWSGMPTLATGIAPICTHLEGKESFTSGAQIIVYNSGGFRLRIPNITGASDVKEMVTNAFNENNPYILVYPLATPEESVVSLHKIVLTHRSIKYGKVNAVKDCQLKVKYLGK